MPTMKELVAIEFDLPDISISAFDDPKEYGKFLEKLVWHFDKQYQKLCAGMEKQEKIIKSMSIFLDKYPELFGENYSHEVGRDMMKFFMYAHADKLNALVDKIEQIEKDLDLPIH